MPEICHFYGIVITMYLPDHNPPHFHVEYGGEEMLVRIDDAEPIEGDLPPRQKKLILGWAVLHHDELMENWALAAQQKELFPIEPLR